MNDRRTFAVAAALVLAALGAIAFGVAYVADAGRLALGVAMTVAAASLCAAGIGYAFWMTPDETATDRLEGRDEHCLLEYVPSAAMLGRRRLLARLFYAALGLFGASTMLPIRSLAPRTGGDLQATKWRAGVRLARDDGRFVSATALEVGSSVTVFPEGAMEDPPSQVVLVRLPQGSRGTVDGYVAFSRVCTHAGCPVALYRASAKQLMCPCHQSVFDVAADGAVVSGPADRALPRLPIHFGSDGLLAADGDFPAPVGPAYWTMSDG